MPATRFALTVPFRALDVATQVGMMQDGDLKVQVSTADVNPAALEALYLKTMRMD